MKKFLSFSTKKKILVVFIAIVLVLILIFIFKNGNGQEETIVVKMGNFVDQVSISGKVIPSENVELGFKNSGRIERINFSVDPIEKRQIVGAGALLAQIDTTDALKDVHDAEIALENARLSLAKIKVENSEENLNADLEKAYDDGFIAVSGAFLDLQIIIDGLEDILDQDNFSDNTARISGNTALDYKEETEKLFYKTKNAFKVNRIDFRILNRNSPKSDIENIINQTYDTTKILMDALKNAKNLADYLSEDTDRTLDYESTREDLYEYINTINEHLSNLFAIKTDIKDYRDAFSSADLDIQSLELSVKQKEFALNDARNKLEDYYIRAPFAGIITKIDAKVGQIAYPNTPLISMMSLDTFQIESFVPEVNIDQIKMGDQAKITLDTYGDETFFLAQVISIDPAETVRDGVSTYKVRLQFAEQDDRIKSGMTANVAIETFNKPNVLVIPEGVILEEKGKKFVQIKKDKKIEKVEIITGNISSLGQVEVNSGLSEGDEVILNPTIK